MNKLIFVLLALISINAMADNYVRGYVKKDGTYVEPHYRSDSNSTKFDNYSTKGNYNPYTGQQGTVDPYQYQNPYNSNTIRDNNSLYR